MNSERQSARSRRNVSILRLNDRRNGFAVVYEDNGAIVRIDGNLAFKLTSKKARLLVGQLDVSPEQASPEP